MKNKLKLNQIQKTFTTLTLTSQTDKSRNKHLMKAAITIIHHRPSFGGIYFSQLVNFLLIKVLTVIGAFCSGMGVGFCNIDKLQLEVMTMSKDPQEQRMAKTIHDVVSNHHLWLVTILVYNAIALESLPLVVHTLMPDWAAIIFSTIVVLIAA